MNKEPSQLKIIYDEISKNYFYKPMMGAFFN